MENTKIPYSVIGTYMPCTPYFYEPGLGANLHYGAIDQQQLAYPFQYMPIYSERTYPSNGFEEAPYSPPQAPEENCSVSQKSDHKEFEPAKSITPKMGYPQVKLQHFDPENQEPTPPLLSGSIIKEMLAKVSREKVRTQQKPRKQPYEPFKSYFPQPMGNPYLNPDRLKVKVEQGEIQLERASEDNLKKFNNLMSQPLGPAYWKARFQQRLARKQNQTETKKDKPKPKITRPYKRRFKQKPHKVANQKLSKCDLNGLPVPTLLKDEDKHISNSAQTPQFLANLELFGLKEKNSAEAKESVETPSEFHVKIETISEVTLGVQPLN